MTQAVRCAVGPWSMNRLPTWATGWHMANAGSLASDVRRASLASEESYTGVAHASYEYTVDWASSAAGEYRNCCAASQLP
jgi:hypothetical protein